MNTDNIQKFLMPPDEGGAYTDEKLASLLAHAQDGKLSYMSCCCLVGSATADHPLRTTDTRLAKDGFGTLYPELRHVRWARFLANAEVAEGEFFALGYDTPVTLIQIDAFTPEKMAELATADAKRRERLIPLILAEMERREKRAEPDPRDEEGSDVRPEIEVYRGR